MNLYSKHPYFVMHFIILLWGFTAVLAKFTQLDAVVLVLWRMGIALVCLYVFSFFSVRTKKLSLATKLKMMGVGSLIALHWIFFFHAIKVSNISLTLAIITSGGFMVSIIEPILFGRKVRKYEIILGVLSVLLFIGILDVRMSLKGGIISAFIATFLSSLFSVLNGKIAGRHPTNNTVLYEMLGGFIFTALYMVFFHASSYAEIVQLCWLDLKTEDVVVILMLGVVCTAFAFSVSVSLLRYVTPYTMVLAANLEPVYSIFLGYIIFGASEEMSWTFYFCTSLLIGIVFVENLIKKNKLPFWKRRLENRR